jgi:ATP-binding protein involved in chromosome partitioning
MQLYNQTNWPQLDYLVIDMPPGTGDIQLTLAQRIPVTGAVIVTTPQHIALLDAQKGIEMFNKTNIPVLGVVENMALHTCSNCNHTEAIFGTGGGERIAEQYHVPLLGQLPLASGIRVQVDKGEPSVLADDEFATYYLDIAKNIETNIDKFAKPVDDKRIF